MGTEYYRHYGLGAFLLNAIGEVFGQQDTEGYWGSPARASRRPKSHSHLCPTCTHEWFCYNQTVEIGPFVCHDCRES